MPLELSLDPLQPEDQEVLAELFAANDVPQVTRWFDPFPMTVATAHDLTCLDGLDLYWLGRIEGEVVAFSMVRGWDGGHPQPAYGYFTDRRWHRRGVATAMTGLVLAELHNRGVPEVRARVHVDNVASLRTLRHAGFVDHAVEHGRVVLRAVPGPGR